MLVGLDALCEAMLSCLRDVENDLVGEVKNDDPLALKRNAEDVAKVTLEVETAERDLFAAMFLIVAAMELGVVLWKTLETALLVTRGAFNPRRIKEGF